MKIIILNMPISARNRLRGTIEELVLGNVMGHVVVPVGDNVIESAITRRSAEELKAQEGRYGYRHYQSN
jgi:molybdopterin-binding protein